MRRNREVGVLIGLVSLLLLIDAAIPAGLSAQEYPPDLERGKAIYARHCRSCHGAKGEGNGPSAETLPLPPADFRHVRSILKSDEDLLRVIEHGVVFSPMHAWRGRLTDGEMQDVLAYIRLLSQSSP
ncbi:MAG: cytochrome c [Nitrospira sp.]|nr:cytochrome c [Nitrospira sp.]